ncbi:MAG TPA: ABC transporter permease [Acidimicrobiales bacterium]|nr:ABC transporter permease [Acidimicrobiales bacterium]
MTKLQEITSRRELFVNLTLRELRGKYKRSVLGWAWSLLNPLTTMLVYSIVFTLLGAVPETGDPSGLRSFAFFLMCGLIPYNFISNGLNGGLMSLLGNGNLVKKTYFPREILVAASTSAALVQYLIELGLLVVALLFVGNVVLPWIPVILLLVVFQTLFVLGISLVLSAAAVYFRDLQHLMGLVLQVWFFSAPIVYSRDLVDQNLRDGSFSSRLFDLNFAINPLVRFVSAYRSLFYDLRWPATADLVYIAVVSLLTLAVGFWAFGRLEGRLAEEL